jgi:UDP-N-acetyl-D-mannosaminuronic acid dehydrogenase
VKPKHDTVCVVGLGYVGLPTAAILASRGFDVLGVDVNAETVALVNQGKVHIVEPDLDILVNGAVARGKLKAATRPAPAGAFIIAVPTPFVDDHKPDLSYLKEAAKSIAGVLEKGDLVIIESTLPVGTTEALCAWLAKARPDLRFPHQAGSEADVQVAHSPERVLPGRVLMELAQNDRVIGGVSPLCAERAEGLYRRFVNGECLITTACTAELVKLAENSYRDVNIAFANELSLVCDRLGLNVWDVADLANRHPRVDILKPGPGVGGHCVAVDPWFIIDSAPGETPLMRAARAVNDAKPAHVAARILAAAAEFPAPRIACLGLSYKADIDDLRESPAVEIVRILATQGKGDILVVEPHVRHLPECLETLDRVTAVDLDRALEAADVVVLLVDHKPFKAVAPERLEGKTVIDTRGLWR